MPTLNLGRVRFNLRGPYDPDTDYLKHDVVTDDGQSYACIADVTGTGPNDAGGATYWEGMLLRGADYNAARDEAVQAASDASGSASAAGGSAAAAGDSATAAADSEALSDKWANEAEDVEVETGKYSAKHYAAKAAAFGDPNQFDITADQTSDTRTSAEWMAQVLANQQEISDNASNFAAVTATVFVKTDGSQPAWTAPSGTTLETTNALALAVGSTIVEIAAGTAITLPALSAGTDYTIYASTSGDLQAVDADSAAPAGERVVGGFHASAGGSSIVESSLWDLNWRPTAPSPRGMVLSLDGRAWADIYLCDVDYALNGYSRNGQQIADGNSLPKIPFEYGGDGTATSTSGSWWAFNDILSAAGKRFPHYQEFTALAYGVVERQAAGTDPVTTQHQAGRRSACGCEQASGVMWQWGADITGTTATGSAAWQDQTEGRGDIFTANTTAPLFGADWGDSSNAGSRASSWASGPADSDGSIGARGVCGHVNLQADR